MKRVICFGLAIALVLSLSFAFIAGEVQAQEYVRIGTAGAGGNYYNLGAAMQAVFNDLFNVDADEIPDGYYDHPFMTTIQATQGSPHNVELLATEQVEIAFGLAEPKYAGYHKIGEMFEDRPALDTEDMRFIGYLYPNPVWFVVMDWAEDEIETFRDIKGKRVSVGISGGSSEREFREEILPYLGWTYDDLDQQFTIHGEAIDQVRNRMVDVVHWGDAPGSPSYTEIFETGYANAYSIDEDVIENQIEGTLREKVTMGPGTVEGQENEFETWMDPAILTAHKDVAPEIIYNVRKAMHENRQELIDIFPLAEYIELEESHRAQPFELHEGTKWFYEEMGVLDNFEPHPGPEEN